MPTTTERRPRQRGPFTPRSREGSLVGDRYSLERLIRFDDVSSLYVGRDVVLNRVVAVKVLHQAAPRDPLLVEHFIETERRLAALFHPHLVTIFEAAASDGMCWSAREYCGAGTLKQRLPTRQPIPVWQVTSLLAQTGSALEAAHRAGLVHGRLAPQHVLFDDTGTAKLSGFDVMAMETSAVATSPGDDVARIAPGEVGPQSDQYALALIAVELLTGEWCTAVDAADLTENLGERALDRMREVRPDVPGRLEEALSRALEADPSRRFGSIGAFLAAVAQAGVSEPMPTAEPADLHSRSTYDAVLPSTYVDDQPDELPREPVHLVPGRRVPGWVVPIQARAASAGRALNDHGRAWGKRTLRGVSAAAAVGASSTRNGSARLQDQLRSRNLFPPRVDLAADWFRGREPLEKVAVAAGTVALLLCLMVFVPRWLNPPPPVPTPQVSGVDLDAARAATRAAGLDLRVTEEVSETAPRGTVLRQQPAAGESIRVGDPVRIVVSSGRPPVTVPNLVRREVNDARAALAASGLAAGAIHEFETSRHPWGTIVRQEVVAGRKIPGGEAVDLFVATPPWVDVPSVVHKSLGDAESHLSSKGLKLGEVRTEPVTGRQAGTVLRQQPDPGVRLREGSVIAVVIAVPSGVDSGVKQ